MDKNSVISGDIVAGTVVAIDGPAGSGKSTVAYLLAEKLGFVHLDSGAVYRTLTLAWMRYLGAGESAKEFSLLFSHRIKETKILPQLHSVRLKGGMQYNYIGNEEIGEEIRTSEVASRIGYIADHLPCRHQVNDGLRALADGSNMVVEGRDIGTEVFPYTAFKFFLDAKADVRARRRFQQLQGLGESPSLQQLTEEIKQRDEKDRHRPVGALKRATEAILVDTSDIEANSAVNVVLSHLQVMF